MQDSTPTVKLVPGMKTKVLSVMIPIVVAVGIAMVIVDHYNVANAQEQGAMKAGGLLIAYCIFSFRSLNRYRVFVDLEADKMSWRQGFPPLGRNIKIAYSQIESLTITSLTTTLIFNLKPEAGLPKELRLAPSFRIQEGQIAKPTGEKIEKEIASTNPQVCDIYYLKYEIEKRMAQSASTS